MNIYRGIGVSDGIVVGKALTIYSAFINYPRIQLESDRQVAHEMDRIRKAKADTEEQIDAIVDNATDVITDEFQLVLAGYKLFLNDKRFFPAIEKIIETRKINAEWALINVLADLQLQFSKIPDPYIRSRFDEVRQLGERTMNNLLQKPHFDLSNLKEPVILISHDISPADALHIDGTNILGFVTELGGATSHLAILASAMNIPSVVGVQNVTARIQDGETVILDGSSGEVICRPDKEILEDKLSKRERLVFYQKQLQELASSECELADGVKVDIAANLDFPEELDQIDGMNINSIGLIRTEFMFPLNEGFPDEEEQTRLYRDIVEKFKRKSITLRTWDLGGDKTSDLFPELTHETNPALGMRAIRICLKHRNFFRTQIRAILKASGDSDIRLMIPMVTRLEEVISSKEIIEEEGENLHVDPRNVKVGCMIETPGSVFIIEELLDLVDFISIGSNDLIQYALAVDRMNENVASFYTPFHPSILKMIERIVVAANRRNKEVSICGEIAADPIMQMFLLGTGKITFSMSPSHVLRTKRILKKVDANTCKKIAFQFVSKHSLHESDSFVRKLRNEYMENIEPS